MMFALIFGVFIFLFFIILYFKYLEESVTLDNDDEDIEVLDI